jgi:hypothetical protein
MTTQLDDQLNSSAPSVPTSVGVDRASRQLVVFVTRRSVGRLSRRARVGIGAALAIGSVLSASAAVGSTDLYNWIMGTPDFTMTRTFTPAGFPTATCQIRWLVSAEAHETPRPGEIDAAREFIASLDLSQIQPHSELYEAEMNAGWGALPGSSPATVEAGAVATEATALWGDHARADGYESVVGIESEARCTDVNGN